MRGLEQRYHPVTEELKKRLDYELSTIKNMGYVDYFLIVWDFIKYARDNDIMVGPGRGSAAGSLVAYTLGITQLDPIRYDLLFERFLNPERVSMPDIDVDFCFERRQEVIDYVRRKYGDDCVVQIVTFGTLAARGVIRDVGRVLDMPYAQVDTIAKMIPQELNITIDKALGMNPEFRKAYEEQDDIHRLIDLAKRLGGASEAYLHACGRCCDQPEGCIGIRTPFQSTGWFHCHAVYHDNTGRAGTSENGFPGSPYPDGYPECCENGGKNTGMLLDMQKIDYNDKRYWILSEQDVLTVCSSWRVPE